MSDQSINRSVQSNDPNAIEIRFLNAGGTGFASRHRVSPGTTVESFLAANLPENATSFRQFMITVKPQAGEPFTPDADYTLQAGDYLTATFQGQKGA